MEVSVNRIFYLGDHFTTELLLKAIISKAATLPDILRPTKKSAIIDAGN